MISTTLSICDWVASDFITISISCDCYLLSKSKTLKFGLGICKFGKDSADERLNVYDSVRGLRVFDLRDDRRTDNGGLGIAPNVGNLPTCRYTETNRHR